jgi:hypothetical protein
LVAFDLGAGHAIPSSSSWSSSKEGGNGGSSHCRTGDGSDSFATVRAITSVVGVMQYTADGE